MKHLHPGIPIAIGVLCYAVGHATPMPWGALIELVGAGFFFSTPWWPYPEKTERQP